MNVLGSTTPFGLVIWRVLADCSSPLGTMAIGSTKTSPAETADGTLARSSTSSRSSSGHVILPVSATVDVAMGWGGWCRMERCGWWDGGMARLYRGESERRYE